MDPIEPTPQIRRTDSQKASILLIDNDPLMLTAMASVMHMQEHRAVMARDEAVANSALKEQAFDVIVLSIDSLQAGCDFAKRLRGSDSTSDVPIIFLVPNQSASWTEPLAAAGGIYSLLKPIDPNSLIDLVERALWMPHVARGRLGAPISLPAQRQSDWISLPE